MTDRERLVELLNKKYDHFCDQCGVNKDSYYTDNLADYLLADGWMRPPCKVGSDIYTIQNGEVKKHFVIEVSKHVNGNSYIKYVPYDKNGIAELNWVQSRCTDKDIGRLIYLSREEAEKALRGGGEG